MNVLFDKISKLNAKLHFCEDFEISGPVDWEQRPVGGPLAGKVVGIKSNISVTGQSWTAGIGGRVVKISKTDASVVNVLRSAGALILSRLAMDEGALGASTDNPHFGRCENPAFSGYSAGGSSGGSAAAVAAGAVDVALGTDTMGSVRIPAAYCGVYGLKVGSGMLSMEGVAPLAPSLDAMGFFAKTPELLSDVLAVLSPAYEPAGNVVGWIAPERKNLAECDSDVLTFFDDSCAVLTDLLGQRGTLPEINFSALRRDAFLLTEVEAVASLGADRDLSPNLGKLIDYGRRVSPQKLNATQGRLRIVKNTLREALNFDRVLLLPSVAAPAFEHESQPPVGQADFTVLANIADLPAISVPKPGAFPPVAVQIIGPAGMEQALIELAARFSAAL